MLKFFDGQTDGRTDSQSDYYRAPATPKKLSLYWIDIFLKVQLYYCFEIRIIILLNNPFQTSSSGSFIEIFVPFV